MQNDWVTVGRVRTVFGVKGWLKIESFTEPVDNILQYPGWRLVADERARKPISIELREVNRRQHDILVSLVGIENREDAKQFANHLIQIPRSALPELEADDYYWHELEGLEVYQVDETGKGDQPIGRVTSLLETGANDVLVVVDRAQGEILIPYLPGDVVKQVDVEAGRIRVDWRYRD